jgi:hypothetical protein
MAHHYGNYQSWLSRFLYGPARIETFHSLARQCLGRTAYLATMHRAMGSQLPHPAALDVAYHQRMAETYTRMQTALLKLDANDPDVMRKLAVLEEYEFNLGKCDWKNTAQVREHVQDCPSHAYFMVDPLIYALLPKPSPAEQ